MPPPPPPPQDPGASAAIGRLEVITGPMFAGKTTELLRRLREAAQMGAAVAAIKPAIDDRYHPTDLTTHARDAIRGRTIRHPEELAHFADAVLGLDEAHFFTAGLHRIVLMLVGRGVRVIVAGLDRTSFGEPFGEMALLLVEADEVIKLTAPCSICGRPAAHTVRMFESDEDIVIGGTGMFENRCRAHLDAPNAEGEVPFTRPPSAR